MPEPYVSEVFEDCAPIFIVGAPRSGTTLLERMLDAHPAIAIADEIIFFDIILQARERVPELDSPERIRYFFDLLPAMDHVRYWNHADEILSQVKARLLADARASYGRFYRYFMEAWAQRAGASRFGEKTPWNIRHLAELRRMFPNCRIIHMVRDPRAVVASKMALPRTSRDILTNAVKWWLDVQQARDFVEADAANARRVLEIRYEDLVAQPREVLQQVCDFIGEPFDARMLTYAESADVNFRNQPYHRGVFKPVFSSSLEAWRRSLNEAQLVLIQLIGGPLMNVYGYAKLPWSSSAAARLPLQMLREMNAWRSFKRAERQLREEEADITFRYEADAQYVMLRSMLWSRLARTRRC